MPLIAASAVRGRIAGLTEDDDDEITKVIAAADALAARFLFFPTPEGAASATLSASTYVDLIDGPTPADRTKIRLRVRPVISLEEVCDDPERAFGSDTEVADLELDGEKGVVYLSSGSTHAWSRTPRAIRATYTAGWDDEAPPAELVEAMLRMVAAIWNRRHVPGLPNAATVAQLDPLADAAPYLLPFRLWERAAGAP